MDEIKKRLERELSHTVQRIRHMGGVMTFEELGGGRGDSPLADEVDVIRVNEDREMSFATRSLLVDARQQAGRGARAAARVGSYGMCEECGEPIAPARLRALPEVTTCVRCQDRLERMMPRLEAVAAAPDADESEDE